MIIKAPYPTTIFQTVIPDSELGNSERSESKITVHRLTDGTLQTYKNVQRKIYRYEFSFDRRDALRLYAYIKAFGRYKWGLFENATPKVPEVVGYYINNPSELAMIERSKAGTSNEKVPFILEIRATE